MRRRRLTEDEKSIFYETAAECAAAAAPIFVQQRWRWTRLGIPGHDDILSTLYALEKEAKAEDRDYLSTGRLTFSKGRFGHERPKTVTE